VRGDLRCVVAYDGRFFAMENADAMRAFMSRPWKFHSLPPPKSEPRPPPVPLQKCVPSRYWLNISPVYVLYAPLTVAVCLRRGRTSTPDFLQRTVTDALRGAVSQVAALRPAFPFASPEESVLRALALTLLGTMLILFSLCEVPNRDRTPC
jgi:hypothetical protein